MDIGQADMAGALIWLCAGHSAAVIFDDEKDFVLLPGDKDGKQTILFCLAETVEDRVFYQGLEQQVWQFELRERVVELINGIK